MLLFWVYVCMQRKLNLVVRYNQELWEVLYHVLAGDVFARAQVSDCDDEELDTYDMFTGMYHSRIYTRTRTYECLCGYGRLHARVHVC